MFYVRDEIINLFEKGIFPSKDNLFKTEKKEESKEKLDGNKFFNCIENESEDIKYELFEKHFNFKVPSALAKKLFETTDKKRNNNLVNASKSRLRDLKNKIEKMSKDEIEIEKQNKIVNIVEEILEFNEKIQKQSGGGLKILTPNQMLSRSPIPLAQLKAGNNSEKLINEIRQLLYSLYRSKKITKQLYKSLIDII